jgi:hypothetical protein
MPRMNHAYPVNTDTHYILCEAGSVVRQRSLALAVGCALVISGSFRSFMLACLRKSPAPHFFNIIKNFRDIAMCYEKTARNYLAGLHLDCTLA